MYMKRNIRFASLPLLLATIVVAQAAEPTFEAASVRASGGSSGARVPASGLKSGGPGTNDPGRIVYRGVPFMWLLMDAYGVEADAISGPAWATTFGGSDARFDVQATLRPGANAGQLALMLRGLLIERFHLAVHRLARQTAGYSLVIGKSGPRMKQSRGRVGESEQGVAVAGGGYNPNSFEADGFPRLFPGRNEGGTISAEGVVRMRFRDYTVGQLADQLSYALGARVRDDTSLNERYDFTFEFVPPGPGAVGLRLVMQAPADRHLMFIKAPSESQLESAPILSSALEKQLGLKLEARKITIDGLVIDHVDKTPVEN